MPTAKQMRRALRRPEPQSYGFPWMATILPENAKQGNVALDRVTLSERMAERENLRMMMSGFGIGRVDPGTYARLVVDGQVMMSDTSMERRTNRDFLSHAHGHVLVFGLGLGMIVHAALAKPEVTSITVVENNRNVIDLIAPSLADAVGLARLRIIEGDAFTWKPTKGETFNTIYFDIWPTISDENLPQMGRLLRRAVPWKDRTDPKLWVGCWMRDYLLADRRRDSRRGWGW